MKMYYDAENFALSRYNTKHGKGLEFVFCINFDIIIAMDYVQEKETALRTYQSINNIFCPALSTEITFNQKGFKHIIYKKGRHVRDTQSQIMRFKLIPIAKKVLEITTTIQEYSHEEADQTRYWGFIAIIDNRKVKVIIRKVGNGSVHFWSIVPNWKTNKKRDLEKNISFMKGDPEID